MVWRRRLQPVVAAVLFLTAGCGGGGGGTIATSVDTSYTFPGAQPGISTRNAGRGTIAGTLTDTTLKAASGITVTLYRLTRSRQTTTGYISTVSNANGHYVFGNLEPGSYRVQVLLVTADVTVAGDADTTQDFANVGPGSNSKYKWTMMIYLDADNDLEEYGVLNVNQMELLPNSDDVAIVVQMDRIRGYDSSNNDWTGARRFRVRHDTDTATMTSAKSPAEGGTATVLGAVNSGTVSSVRQFISWAQTAYPADHYLLDVWNHGAGWRRRAAATDLLGFGRGVLYDDTSNSYLTTPQTAQAFAGPSPIDIIMFDSSLMQMAEVAYELRSNASYIVGSEESPPGDGYPYDHIFDLPIATPSTSAEALAIHVVNNTIAQMGTRYALTQSALRANQLDALGQAISAYADLLSNNLTDYRTKILSAREAAQRYGSPYNSYEGYRDLMDFAGLVATKTGNTSLATGRDTLQAALSAALAAESHSGTAVANSHGLSIFIPTNSDWVSLRSSYLETAFGQNVRWAKFLDKLYGVN